MKLPSRRTLGIFGLVVVALGAGTYANAKINHAHAIRDVLATGAVELDTIPTRYKVWWDSAARCLGVDARWDARIRVFIGVRVPASWKVATDHGQNFGGYHRPPDLLWMRDRDVGYAMLTHEVGHLRLWRYTHPVEVFGKDGTSPICGLAPV